MSKNLLIYCILKCDFCQPFRFLPSTCLMTWPTVSPRVWNAAPPGRILMILASSWLVSLPPSITIPRQWQCSFLTSTFTRSDPGWQVQSLLGWGGKLISKHFWVKWENTRQEY